jgi:hypothetical protein
MSALEDVRKIMERIATASAKDDFAPFMAALDGDLEVFDHAAYSFREEGRVPRLSEQRYGRCRGNDVRIPSAVVWDVQ